MDLTSAFNACVEQRLTEYKTRAPYAVVAACRYCEKALKIDPKKPVSIVGTKTSDKKTRVIIKEE